jgi:O-acetyl-ADP-ribose deacetylase (regulator of RNase III)
MTQPSNTVDVVVGDLFEAPAQTLVNTVNCVGVMGKGVALEFKKRFPAMYEDYVARCERGEVKLGRPYLYRNPQPPHVLDFPTKGHWRSVSRLKDIVTGLDYLEAHYRDWGITSLAVPPLGCGNGGLEWGVIGPTLYQHLSRLDIPVALYAPFNTPHAELAPRYLQRTPSSNGSSDDVPQQRRLQPGWVALAAALADLLSDPHHWPIGKTSFHKLAYFLTASGVPTGLDFQRGTYGPYAADLTRVISTLVNNDLLQESQLGPRMIELKVGDTFSDARVAYEHELAGWHDQIHQAADLLARLQTRDAEIAATVHLVATEASAATGEPPTDEAILTEVMEWKCRKRPPLREDEVLNAVHSLAMLGWLQVSHSERIPLDEVALVGF